MDAYTHHLAIFVLTSWAESTGHRPITVLRKRKGTLNKLHKLHKLHKRKLHKFRSDVQKP